MNDDGFFLFMVVAVIAFLVYREKPRRSMQAAGRASASGVPPANNGGDLTSAIGGAVASGACVAGASAFGAPQAGAALAPVCGVLGKFAAPYVVKGVVAGAEFAGHEAAAGAQFVARNAGSAASELITNPFAPVTVPTKLAAAAIGTADRVATTLLSHTPAVVKLAAAPIYYPTKAAVAAIGVGARAAGVAASGISWGAKSSLHAVESIARPIGAAASTIGSAASSVGSAASSVVNSIGDFF